MTADRILRAIDATLTATEAPMPEPTATAKTDAPGTDPGINLTKQALTDADRAALYPTVPADPPAVDIIDRHLLASAHYYGAPGTRRDEARRIADDLADPPAAPYDAGDAPTGHSFATYLGAQERDQLDARAATAEQERDDALDDLRELRTDHKRLVTLLNTTREALHLPADGHPNAIPAEAAAAFDAVANLSEQLAKSASRHTELHRTISGLEADLRSQNRAVRELTAELKRTRPVVDAAYALAGSPATLRATFGTLGERLVAAVDALPAPALGSVAGHAQDQTSCPGSIYATDPTTPDPCIRSHHHEPPCITRTGMQFDAETDD